MFSLKLGTVSKNQFYNIEVVIRKHPKAISN